MAMATPIVITSLPRALLPGIGARKADARRGHYRHFERMPDHCRICKQPVRAVVAAGSGEPLMLDYDPVDDGIYVLVEPRYADQPPRAAVVIESRRENYAGSLYRSHPAPCDIAWKAEQ